MASVRAQPGLRRDTGGDAGEAEKLLRGSKRLQNELEAAPPQAEIDELLAHLAPQPRTEPQLKNPMKEMAPPAFEPAWPLGDTAPHDA